MTTVVGKYRLNRLIGEGGMGCVYAATHVGIGTRVAVKMLRREVIGAPTIAERFMREARAAGQVKSEHVCQVLDIGATDDGLPYMVMELLDGSDLATAVQRERPSARTAAGYLIQACAGLAEAHRRGMVHRDIKPANLFLTTRNGAPFVKILDFGIATAPRDEAHPSLTSAQMVMGSPNYMSPEQISSARDVDPRSDVWSLGVSLYELVSGQLPFQEPSFTALSIAIATEPHRPLTGMPPELAEIVDRCLAKRREDRFANASELAAALEAFCAGTSARRAVVPAPAMPNRRRARGLVVVAGLGVVAAVAVGLVVVGRTGGKPPDRVREAYDRWATHWGAAHDCLFGPKHTDDVELQLELHVFLDTAKSAERCDPWLTGKGDGDNAESALGTLAAGDFASVDVYDAMLHLRNTVGALRCDGDDCALRTRAALREVVEADQRVRNALAIPPVPPAPLAPLTITLAPKIVTLPDDDYAGWTLHAERSGTQSHLTKAGQKDWWLDTTTDHYAVHGIADAKDPILWAEDGDGNLRYFRSTGERAWPETDLHGVIAAEAQGKRLDVVAYADPRARKGALAWTILVPGSRPPVTKLRFEGQAAWQCLAGDSLWIHADDKPAYRFVRGTPAPDEITLPDTFTRGSPAICGPTRVLISRGLECSAVTRTCEPVHLPSGTTLYAGDRLVTVEPSPTRTLLRVHVRDRAPSIMRVPDGDTLGEVFAQDGHIRAHTRRGAVVELLH